MTESSKPRSNLKVQELCALLRELAFQKGPGAKLPTTRELCEQFNTTPATLNDALKELESQNIIYCKLRSGIFVSPKLYRKSICTLFYADLFPTGAGTSPFWGIFWSLFAREVERRSETRNEYHTFHFVLDRSATDLDLPEEVVRMIEAGNIHGILAAGMQMPTFNWLTKHKIPSVSYAGLGTCMVNTDSINQTQLAVAQLAEQGCQSLALWMPKSLQVELEADPCVEYFSTAMSTHGLTFDPQLVRAGGPFSTNKWRTDYQEQGYQLTLQVFEKGALPRPDGIFITDDMMTTGVLEALSELNIRVGVDVQIVSHANAGSPTLFRQTKRLSIVEIDPVVIVQTMFALLDQLMAGQTLEQQRVMIPSTLKKIQL
ncbi:GntR family transcriptional regulator [Tengunoibacter tsumagoiensis]|uniref:HTH gntR-type domain-containing protein n=1 Tax=Tengunoibacter tsumagoiensis TaxID=2014871 RepID=A0A401ZUL5_9CHLR|nr:GntR family transcriptional regulator [Tengunoibacter tsumagoiensis]GCE10591.1 hypothetical protein KTT_04500 [Tengunoibacter tsumagoiensis]